MNNIRCACPKIDARDCIRWRCKDDMREHLGAPTICDDDEECSCACHEEELPVDDVFDCDGYDRLRDEGKL